MTALRVPLWFWQLITRLSYFSQVFLQNKELLFSPVGEPLHDHEHILHDPPPFNGPFFMTPPFSAVSKSCDPPSVSTPSPLLISDKSLNKVVSLRPIIVLFTSFTGSLTVASFTIYNMNNTLTTTTIIVINTIIVRPPDRFSPGSKNTILLKLLPFSSTLAIYNPGICNKICALWWSDWAI